MRVVRLAVILLVVLVMTGCWSRRELTEVSFTGMLGLDWEDDQYVVTVNILSPRRVASETGKGDQKVWTVSERAPAIDQAISRLDQMLSRSITLAHIRAVIYGEDLARHGIGQSLDYLLRSVEIRPTAWVGVTPGRAMDLLKARPRQEMALSDSPIGYQDAATQRSSITPSRRKTEVANLLREEGISLTLPSYRIAEEPPPRLEGALKAHAGEDTEVAFGGAGVFLGDRLVEWLSPEAARGLLIAHGRAVHGAVSAPCESNGSRIVYRLRKSSGKVTTWVTQGKVRSRIEAKVVADVNDFGCPVAESTSVAVDILHKRLEKQVMSQIQAALDVQRTSGADIFGFGQALFRHSPEEYTRREKGWTETVRQMPVEVSVNVQVPRLGQINRTYEWRRPPQ